MAVARLRSESPDHPEPNTLLRRIQDWKGHQVPAFGQLLLHDTFLVTRGQESRQYYVLLFERILLCCKELEHQQGMPLKLKGTIHFQNLMGAEPVPEPECISSILVPLMPDTPTFASVAARYLRISWCADDGSIESLVLRCRDDSQLRVWQDHIKNIIVGFRAREAMKKGYRTSLR